MGNRAVITTQEYLTNPDTIGVYLHWNGGRDSVQAFLLYCKVKGYRPPDEDCYGWARSHLEEMAACGFRLYESEDYGLVFGIDGAGYSFYDEHWLPLYKARGLHWHDKEEG